MRWGRVGFWLGEVGGWVGWGGVELVGWGG